jgi:hypothetical protein
VGSSQAQKHIAPWHAALSLLKVNVALAHEAPCIKGRPTGVLATPTALLCVLIGLRNRPAAQANIRRVSIIGH